MKEILTVYKSPIIGGITGLVFAILFLNVGFFKTILVVIMVVLGIFIGNYISKSDFFGKIINK